MEAEQIDSTTDGISQPTNDGKAVAIDRLQDQRSSPFYGIFCDILKAIQSHIKENWAVRKQLFGINIRDDYNLSKLDSFDDLTRAQITELLDDLQQTDPQSITEDGFNEIMNIRGF